MATAFTSTSRSTKTEESPSSSATAPSTFTNGDDNVRPWVGNRRGDFCAVDESSRADPIIANMVAVGKASNKPSLMSNSMACDKCRQTPDSLSEFHTLPCLHTLCRQCFQPQGTSHVPASLLRVICPICGGGASGHAIGGHEETSAGIAAATTSASFFHNYSPFSLFSPLGAIGRQEQLSSPSFAAIVSSYGSAVPTPTAAQTQATHVYNEQLNVDTSMLIGNLLDSVSVNDDMQSREIQAADQRFLPLAPPLSKYPTTANAFPLNAPATRNLASSSAVFSPTATVAGSSFLQSPRIRPVHQQPRQQLFSLAVGSQRPITGSSPFVQQQVASLQTAKIPTASSPAAQSVSTFPPCSICLDGAEAACRCEDCAEYLCAKCMQAHLRVRLTKDHRITSLPQSLPPQQASVSNFATPSFPGWATGRSIDSQETSNRSNQPPALIQQLLPVASVQQAAASSLSRPLPPVAGYCVIHRFEPYVFYCETCAEPLCRFCTANPAAHPLPAHRISSIAADRTQAVGEKPGTDSAPLSQLFTDSRQCVRLLDEAVHGVDHMTERVETRMHSVANEIRAIIHHHIGALEERKRELLERVDAVRKAKLIALNSQKEELRKYLMSSKSAIEQAEKLLQCQQQNKDNDGEQAERIRTILQDQLRLLTSSRPCLQPQEDDQLSFASPDANILKTVRLLGSIVTGAYAANCTLLGDALRRAVKDKPIYYTVQARDHVGEPLTCGGDQVNGFVVTTSSADAGSALPIPVDVFDKRNGTYMCRFEPKREGEYQVHIFVRGCPIRGSPFKLIVSRGRDYTSIGATPVLSFGGEGTGDGQLCRPWGICCDKQGRIIVADRSNSRIQIFDQEGRFLHRFGQQGTRPGQFDRPAGVTVNSKQQIVVVDKDNHRVQVFTSDGQFLFKFGEKGRGNGQFNYPWDVAVSSNDDSIAISDTRNHRVQLFDTRGNFLNKFGFESSFFYKQFDSPRGLVFAPDGRLVCTDFNNHRLAVIDVAHNQMEFFGREGEYDGAFKRPQGLDMDLEGNLLIADSRNNRVSVFSPQLTFLCSFGIEGYPPRGRSVIDRPCDVCVCEGKVFVVDFGNNKIHVY